MSNAYHVEKGIIYSEQGLPYAPRWFCDGRLALQADNEGIADINFFGANSDGYIAFHKRFWGGMKFYAITPAGKHLLAPKKCQIWPFGYRSAGDLCDFCLYVANETIYLVLQPQCDMDFAAEFYDDYLFYPEPAPHGDIRYRGDAREWSPFRFDNNRLSVTYASGEKKTNILFSSNANLSYEKKQRNGKHLLSARQLRCRGTYVLAIHFSNGENRDFSGFDRHIQAQFDRYRNVAEKAPVLKSSHEKLNQFIALAPMYHESLKTTDIKGAIRAQSTHYWVWGWDSMTSNQCCFYWGDQDFMGDMLECMERYSDGNGIAHAFGRDMSNLDVAAPPAQGMYLCIMDLYRLSGGDISKHYHFAKALFDMILNTEVADTGLCRGTSLYPDARNLIHETGNDISAFNNTVCYCSARSMEKIAISMGDFQTAEIARAFCRRLEENFSKILFNSALGFFDSSVDASTYRHRSAPGNNAVKWENNYCGDLVSGKWDACLDFYEKHLVNEAGLLPYPQWCECYDADSNQLHCWWPVMSEFYTRLINRFDRTDLMNQYIGWIEYWTNRLMCPEGISCYCNQKDVPFDNWNAAPGIWHGYSIRGFYNAVIHSYVGVDFDEQGLNFYPYSGDEIRIENLHWGNMTFDIAMLGSGNTIQEVMLNGKSLGNVNFIPYKMLKSENMITVSRNQPSVADASQETYIKKEKKLEKF